ncbi:hypothetical protein HPB50_020343 [Hyalomma asiaticum]|uniref:Uncharacterized protein n=1 Tax=Hyalomma asiaticum TaxID=266040 RepID=A0ACB7SS85_HYAAI|nr:hypothetical protein HPB50_020343 [Hyalomma asiaticum]
MVLYATHAVLKYLKNVLDFIAPRKDEDCIDFPTGVVRRASTGSREATDSQHKKRRHRRTYSRSLGRTLEVYLGIPFARPPVGKLRFLAPTPADPWSDVYKATEPKTACIQKLFSEDFAPYVEQSEDCLYINVWTPASSKPLRAVLVWIHGGGFTFGSSYQHWYDGCALAALHDVVVVTFNYRLNIFGFLNAGIPEVPGNMGLWIRIWRLNGFVTTFALSAAIRPKSRCSEKAPVLSARGLFRRAVFMSGAYDTDGLIDSLADSLSRGDKVAELVGCSSPYRDLASYPEEVLECLRSKPAELLCDVTYNVSAPKVFNFIPSHPNAFFPRRPTVAMKRGEFNSVDIMVGVTATEGTFIAMSFPDSRIQTEELEGISEEELKELLHVMSLAWLPDKFASTLERGLLRELHTEYITDAQFICPSKFFAEEYSEMGNSVYFSVLGYRSAKFPFPKWTGVPHTSDIVFYFGVPLLMPEHFTEEDREFSKTMMKAFANFAKTGQVF